MPSDDPSDYTQVDAQARDASASGQPPGSGGEITRLLGHWSSGQSDALDTLLPLVYQELRGLAATHLFKERSNHTLQPTALVHEAWLRLVDSNPGNVECKTHFFAAAALTMRRILVEHARRRSTKKRAGDQRRITIELEETPGLKADLAPDLLDVHDALEDLNLVSERQAKLVELRYFGGLTVPEAAQVLDTSVATAEREWTAARYWLRRRLASYG